MVPNGTNEIGPDGEAETVTNEGEVVGGKDQGANTRKDFGNGDGPPRIRTAAGPTSPVSLPACT